ncbi:hypothetical protein [Arcobacter sp. FWKO B]|uniref:hypothetical protein n=1 Tax=Arcobacter sp. FWKO B TaxID=2593672 RepID=UPI0018A46674|nr:hypothetical protein [Arcobacter sp. FWKO B]QOG12885.1 hypothetical protein FWKOB_09350 [Arcobacter sp. FWKO B]
MNQSIKINNWFALITIVIMTVVITIYVKYVPQETKPILHSNLPCQKEVICFDKVYDIELLKEGYELLQKGNYELLGDITLAKHMTPVLDTKVTIEQTDIMFSKAIDIVQNHDAQKYLTISYQLIENDKEDPNKKSDSDNCKLFAGYILTSFRVNGIQAFRMQIDFNTYDLKEIEQRINCTIEAFKYNGTN